MKAHRVERYRLGLAVIAILAVNLPTPSEAMGPAAFTIVFRYDAAGRLVGKIEPDPDGDGPLGYPAERYNYDAAGRRVSVEHGQLASWQDETIAPSGWSGFVINKVENTEYNGLGDKVAESESSSGSIYTLTQYSYNSDRHLECTAIRLNPADFQSEPGACELGIEGLDGPDRIEKKIYDYDGQIITVVRALGTSIQQNYQSYTYDLDGMQLSVLDANGNKTAYTYDGFNRLTQINFPSSTEAGQYSADDYELYGYDANDNRASLRKRDGRTFTYSYDSLNRMTSKLVPDGCAPIQVGSCASPVATRDVYYTYDLRGLQTAARYDSAVGADAVTSTYDGFGELATSTTAMGGVSWTLAFQYDANGNRIRVTHPDSVFFTYSYDGLDRLVAITENGTATIASLAYNPQSVVTTRTRGAATTTYGYDPIVRPASIFDDLAGADADVSTTFTHNSASQLKSRTETNDAYAWNGSVDVSRTYVTNGLNQYTRAGSAAFLYDANGNLISDGTTGYVYDAENRMVIGGTVALAYDPLGRLYQTTGGSLGTTRYLYDGDKLVGEYGDAAVLLRRYVHGLAEDTPLAWYEGAGLADRRSLQDDEQGSIVSVANSVGVSLGINSYDEYGIPGAGNIGRFQYTGQAWVPELGMYYYKARMYSPTLGRFMQTDPIGYKDQMNLYAYAGNDPITHGDPSGTCASVDGHQYGLCGGDDAGKAWVADRLADSNSIAGTVESEAIANKYTLNVWTFDGDPDIKGAQFESKRPDQGEIDVDPKDRITYANTDEKTGVTEYRVATAGEIAEHELNNGRNDILKNGKVDTGTGDHGGSIEAENAYRERSGISFVRTPKTVLSIDNANGSPSMEKFRIDRGDPE